MNRSPTLLFRSYNSGNDDKKTDLITAATCETSSSVSDFPTEVVSDSNELVSCPICNIALENDDRIVNQHVDECLNSSQLLGLTGISSVRNEVLPKKRGKTAKIENYFVKRRRE